MPESTLPGDASISRVNFTYSDALRLQCTPKLVSNKDKFIGQALQIVISQITP